MHKDRSEVAMFKVAEMTTLPSFCLGRHCPVTCYRGDPHN